VVEALLHVLRVVDISGDNVRPLTGTEGLVGDVIVLQMYSKSDLRLMGALRLNERRALVTLMDMLVGLLLF
jgi:hypothetical protein